jgi:hypothetical protein
MVYARPCRLTLKISLALGETGLGKSVHICTIGGFV